MCSTSCSSSNVIYKDIPSPDTVLPGIAVWDISGYFRKTFSAKVQCFCQSANLWSIGFKNLGQFFITTTKSVYEISLFMQQQMIKLLRNGKVLLCTKIHTLTVGLSKLNEQNRRRRIAYRLGLRSESLFCIKLFVQST